MASMEARMKTTLREAREAQGLSQEALARKVDVSRQTIINIEKGITVPNVLLAIAIAAIVGFAVGVLFSAIE